MSLSLCSRFFNQYLLLSLIKRSLHHVFSDEVDGVSIKLSSSPDWRRKKKSIGARQIEACDFTSSSVPANVWLPWPGWVSLGRTDNHSSTMASANVNYIWSEIYNSYNWSLKCTCMQSWSGNLGKLQISIYVEYDFVFEYSTNLLLLGHWLWPRTLVGSLIYYAKLMLILGSFP